MRLSINRLASLSVLSVVLLIPYRVYGSALTVIFDSGNTRPITLYKNRHKVEMNNRLSMPTKQPDTAVSFPITTPSLSPGKVNNQRFPITHLQTPIFAIGNDHFSKAWLQERRVHLLKLGAIGLLVEAGSQQEVAEILQLGSGLRILPVSGEFLKKQLPLSHYPVLISKQGIEQ